MRHWQMTATALAIAAAAGWAQKPADEGTRALWDSAFLRQRPAARPAVTAQAQRQDQTTAVKGALVGLTLWRLRESTGLDEPGARIFVHSEKGDESWTPERVSADLPLGEGQRFRFSIESTRSGHLYVVDREEYADGSLGSPYLLFPTTAIRGGRNRVSAGVVVELPSWEDNPPYMWLKKSRADHVAEVLTILVTPTPLEGIRPGPQPVAVSADQLAAWQSRWGAQVTRLDSKGSAGKPYTQAEKLAASGGQQLTPSDPVPQTLYLVDSGADEAVLINVPLRIRK